MNYFFYSTYEKITKRIFQVILRRINKFFYLFLFESFEEECLKSFLRVYAEITDSNCYKY